MDVNMVAANSLHRGSLYYPPKAPPVLASINSNEPQASLMKTEPCKNVWRVVIGEPMKLAGCT